MCDSQCQKGAQHYPKWNNTYLLVDLHLLLNSGDVSQPCDQQIDTLIKRSINAKTFSVFIFFLSKVKSKIVTPKMEIISIFWKYRK